MATASPDPGSGSPRGISSDADLQGPAQDPLDPHDLGFSEREWAELDALNTLLLEDSQVGLRYFIQDAWRILEPENPLEWGWHNDAVCDHLQAITRGELTNLLITIPPRFLKSMTVSVFWPCWEWGPAKKPHLRWIFSSYGHFLSLRDSGKRRQILDSAWFRARWLHVKIGQTRFTTDSTVKYENSERGFHYATSVGGATIGEGGHRLIGDDLHNLQEIYSEPKREGAVRYWFEVMGTRVNDPRLIGRVLVMQRGHEADVAGEAIRRGNYCVLCLPNEYDPRRRCVTPFFHDPRTQPGELLFPKRFGAKEVADARVTLGTYAYESQFNQNPSPPEGGILKRAWWRYWVPEGDPLAGTLDANGHPILTRPKRFEQRLQSWDMSFKQTEDGSYVAGLDVGRVGAQAFITAAAHGRWAFTETRQQVKDFRARAKPQYPAAIYVEDKANGPAIVSELRDTIPGLMESAVSGSKESRVHAASPRLEAGNYALPHPALGLAWVEAFIHECAHFPTGATDDYVDAFTQADRHLFQVEQFTEERFVANYEL